MHFNYKPTGNISEFENITQCINNILSIPSGSIPLNRGIGISWTNLSKIPPEMENDIATEIIEKVEEYEPRVSVSNVTFDYDINGVATVNIDLERGESDEYD